MAELVVSRTQWLPFRWGVVVGGRLRRRGPAYRNTTIRSVLKNLWGWLLKAGVRKASGEGNGKARSQTARGRVSRTQGVGGAMRDSHSIGHVRHLPTTSEGTEA